MDKNAFAPTPPMGWNSYDCYDTAVTEAQVRSNAEALAKRLLPFGWEYVVVDIQWYARRPNARRDMYQYLPFGELSLDEYARLTPDPERFPSSAGGRGFGPLAEYVHSLGLKFGIHIMRGIPRIAAHRRLPILGRSETADEIALPGSICRWNPDMYGVADCPAGQAYYDSLLALYASWGVDFIKCDDICNTDNLVEHSPRAYARKHEVEMLSRAIAKAGRPMVLSLSPGPAVAEQAWHYQKHANMWRITDDFWDDWRLLKAMFHRCELWQDHAAPGCWPDCDMLPLGRLGKGFGEERSTRFTPDEQRTMMTLWCIFGSPLMTGAELTKLDDETLSLLTAREVLAMLPCKARQVLRDEEKAVWTASGPETGTRYAALFNLSDAPAWVGASWEELSLPAAPGTELWTGEALPLREGGLSACLPPHACAAYRFDGI